jgi:hypothetical protein
MPQLEMCLKKGREVERSKQDPSNQAEEGEDLYGDATDGTVTGCLEHKQ